MSNKKNKVQDNTLENVELALSKTERFIEENQKNLIIIVLALLIIIGSFWAYIRLYKLPRE